MTSPEIADPERRLALGYAPAGARHALATLFAIDERLAGIVARTTEPVIGLMRLCWWRDALAALETGTPPAEPLLIAAAELASHGIGGEALAMMTAGWEALIEDPELGPETLALHAGERGRRLFLLAGRVLGARPAEIDRLGTTGEGWALADLARHVADPGRAAVVLDLARGPLGRVTQARWRRALRPLGQCAVLAIDDLRRGADALPRPASPSRLLRILRFQITGR